MNQEKSGKLPIRVKFGYGAAEGANSLIFTNFYVFFMFFLTDVVKIDPAFAGFILMLRTLWDALFDPVVGVWSDRIKSKYGRRRPILFAVAVPYGIIAWLLFSDFNLGPNLTKIYFVIIVILHSIAFALLEVPHMALSAEMTQDYDERTNLNAYRAAWSQIFSVISGGACLVLAQYFSKTFHSPRIGWSLMAAGFGLTCIPLILFTWRSTRGYELFPEEVTVKVRDIFDAALKNRPFRYTILMYTLGIAGMSIAGAVMVYFMTYVMGFDEKKSSIGFTLLFACTVLWVPLISVTSNKLGKRGAYFIFIGLWALVQGVGIMALKPGNVILYFILIVLASAGVIGVYMIGWTIIPDVLELDEFKTGQRREGLYYGIISLVQKVGSAIALWLVGVILHQVGYLPNAQQTEKALWGIKIMYGFGTGLLLILSIFFCYLMPMTKKKHTALREAIRLKKEGKPFDQSAFEDLL